MMFADFGKAVTKGTVLKPLGEKISHVEKWRGCLMIRPNRKKE